MARIAGIDLPRNKQGQIGLTYIYGIGRTTARKILEKSNVPLDRKVRIGQMKMLRTYVR